MLILFGLGLRISEALALKWKDIDFDAQLVHVRRRWYRGDLSDDGENKTEASTADVRMSAALAAEFARRYPGPHKLDAFLFTGTRERRFCASAPETIQPRMLYSSWWPPNPV